MAKKQNRIQVILECTEHKDSGMSGTSRYITKKNKKNTPDRIELKKYKRSVEVTELFSQVRKYKSALEKCLKEKFPLEPRVIECICIISSPPEPRDREEENIKILQTINARYITYDTLIQQTLDSYEEYLAKEREVSRIIGIIERLDESLFE